METPCIYHDCIMTVLFGQLYMVKPDGTVGLKLLTY